MVNEKATDQQRLEKFLQHLEKARKLQDDILKYGIDAASLYCEDIDGDWLETWGEDEVHTFAFVKSITAFLESDDAVAERIRKRLRGKSTTKIATELEQCLSETAEEDRIFAIKYVLFNSAMGDSGYRDSSDDDDEIELLNLAEDLLAKLKNVLIGND